MKDIFLFLFSFLLVGLTVESVALGWYDQSFL